MTVHCGNFLEYLQLLLSKPCSTSTRHADVSVYIPCACTRRADCCRRSLSPSSVRRSWLPLILQYVHTETPLDSLNGSSLSSHMSHYTSFTRNRQFFRRLLGLPSTTPFHILTLLKEPSSLVFLSNQREVEPLYSS